MSLPDELAAMEQEVPTMSAKDVLEALAGTARLTAALEARNVTLAAQGASRAAPLPADLVDAKSAARRLGLSLPSIYRLARAGCLPAVRVGADSLRFDPMDLTSWIDKKKDPRGD